mgnify:CR=1 FL=1
MKKNTKKVKLTKEQKERLDNKIVLATAIALVSVMVLLFLYNWSKSKYSAQTMTLIQILMWASVAGVAAMVVLFFIKKDKRFLFWTPYFAVAAVLLEEIVFGHILRTFNLPSTTKVRFNVAYFTLAIYLIATYIYYGIILHRGRKK